MRVGGCVIAVAALAVFTLACGGGGEGPGIVNAPVVVSVTISQPATNPIEIGGTVQLNADVQVQNGASQAVEWSSSAPNVATVSANGLVTGVTGGQTTITATSTANRTKTGTLGITVSPPRVIGVTLNSGARSITVGSNFAVLATVDVRGTLAKTVTFSTSNATVATVSTADGLTGTITGVGAGQATITAASTADPTKTVTLQVTVTGTVRITGLSPVNVRPGTSSRIVPTVQADAGLSTAVQFTSQNTGIATVAADGTVTGVALGQTFVVVKSVGDPNVTANVQVNVRTGVTSVSLTPDRDSLRKGAVRQLALAVVADIGASTAVNLTSANAAIATIDASARVTAIGIGQVYVRAISAIDPTVGDSTLIVVVDPCLSVQPLTPGVNVNGTVSDASCNAVTEIFSYTLTTQTTLAVSATTQFPANFALFADKSGFWFFSLNTAGSGATGVVIAAPGKYAARMTAQNSSQRGTFTIGTSTNVSLAGACNVLATTGITTLVSLSQCGFQPTGRPAGTYSSMLFQLLPVIQAGERLTLTISAAAPMIPLVEVKFGSAAGVQAIATTQTLVQTFTAPVTGFASFTISSRDANQSGNVSVKIEGPPSLAFDSFVFGSGVLPPSARVLPSSIP
jgi:uncharacterized protein YjdB